MNQQINGKTYTDVFTLAEDFYENSDIFASELKKETLLKDIRQEDPQKETALEKLSLLSFPDDVFVFKAGLILNPYLSFRMKGFCFENYKDLGKTMLAFSPQTNPVLMEMVRYGLLSEQMEASGFSAKNPDMATRVLAIEKSAEQNSQEAYFALGYFLSGNETLIFRGVEYHDVYDFTYYLCKNEKDLASLGLSLEMSPLLKAYSDAVPVGNSTKTFLHLTSELRKSQNALDSFLKVHPFTPEH
jgi:hypothetical protein